MNIDTDYIAGAVKTENQDFKGIRERVVNNTTMLEYQLNKLMFELDIELDAVKRLLMYGASLEKIHSKGKQLPEVPEGYISQDVLSSEEIGNYLSDDVIRILHAVLGISTEAGEMIRALYDYIFQGKPLDIINMKEECGDNLWYLALMFDAMETNFTEVCSKNQEKLLGSTGEIVDGVFVLHEDSDEGRYKDGFSEKDALERDTDKEREVLERS